jgi:TolB protein
MINKYSASVFIFCFVSIVSTSNSQVVVSKAGSPKCVLDLSELKHSGGSAEAVFCQTVEDDLKRSGWFTVIKQGKGSFSVQGTCRQGGDSLTVRCQVDNNLNSTVAMSKSYDGKGIQPRRLAHTVADDIIWAIKKVKGMASTRIALVGNRGGKKNIYICDADGANMMQISHDNVICRFPEWSPDATKLLYTAYLSGYPDVYMINLSSYERRTISSYPGLNAGAAFSPDGRRIAIVLSKDGNPDLYIMSLLGGSLTKITRTPYASEASPSWSPDGEQIVYVSDKSGSPQLYIVGSGGGEPRRVTWKGRENVAPDWGPDGRIAYTSRREGKYQICILDPSSKKEEQLTSDWVDHEDPSWAPDSRHIICAQTSNYHSDLYILDTLGDHPVRLTTIQGEWYSPAWSSK